MREIKYIVVHCTATPQSTTIQSIRWFWEKILGWKNPGYHIIVKPNGSIVRLAQDEQVCNGVKYYNRKSIHISYIGGVNAKGKPVDNRTESQKRTLITMLRTMRSRYPNAKILGHRDFPKVRKACPSFNAKEEYQNI